MPAWAKVAPEQIAEAKKHGVPVAFENDLGMRLVLIPAGMFQLGGSVGPSASSTYEGKEVRIEEPFYLQVTEVTNGQYRKYRSQHSSGELRWGDVHPRCAARVSLDGEEQPAVRVSHSDALRFAAWLSKHDECRSYGLPSDTQWEYAYRAGTSTWFWWGNDAWERDLNFSHDWSDGSSHSLYCGTVAVGSFSPNPWGLYDMEANVQEWCSDWHGHGREYPGENLAGPSDGTDRVLRGGSWWGYWSDMIAVDRRGWPPEGKHRSIGFRLVSPLPVPPER